MALDRIGEPFKGVARYWVEGSYGNKSGVTLPISCKVQNVRVDSGDRHKILRDIGSPLVCDLLQQTYEPSFHIEYIPQCDDTLIDDVIDRGSCCTLQSLTFEVGINTCLNTDNQSWYVVSGCKPSTVRVSASKNTEYMVVVDFEARSVVTSGVSTNTAPAVLTGAYLQFNVAGEIRKTGGHIVDVDHIGFITNAIDITVTHQLTGYTDHDSLHKSHLIEGTMDVEGSADITLDGGGAKHFNEVWGNGVFDLVIDMGGANCPRITLPNCEWKSTSIETNVSGEAIMESAPFTCKPSGCTNIVGTVPP